MNFFGAYTLISSAILWKFEARFYASLIASVMMGVSTAIGETTTVAWIWGFPSELVGAWSMGTGLAGLGGIITILTLRTIPFFDQKHRICKISLNYIFLIFIHTHWVEEEEGFASREEWKKCQGKKRGRMNLCRGREFVGRRTKIEIYTRREQKRGPEATWEYYFWLYLFNIIITDSASLFANV